jgi:hypothetical protein
MIAPASDLYPGAGIYPGMTLVTSLQNCMVVNSGTSTTIDLDVSKIKSGWGNNAPPSWAPCWQVMDNGDGTFTGIGWLAVPPEIVANALVEIGLPFPAPPPVVS